MFTLATALFALAATAFAIPAPDVAQHGVTRIASTTSTSISVPTPTAGSPPPNFNITGYGYNGSGCPTGSTFSIPNSDNTAITITFSQFEATAGPGIAINQGRKNCQISLQLHVPQGFSFAIVDVDYRGFYQLDSKVKAYHDASYYFQGQLAQAAASSVLSGPVSGANYIFRDEFNLTPTIYSPCGEDTVLNINSAVRVDISGNKQGFGYITDDSIDAKITQTFNFQWLHC
jgi:hypothetical protein